VKYLGFGSALSSSVSAVRALNPARLSGPIFDKELRVSSRKKRNYVLRFLYVLALTGFILIAWTSLVSDQYVTIAGVVQMSQAGKLIISTIIWYQFIILQLIAIVMLSASISDEIYHKTLGLLMTTPITGFQIVFGKLLSGLMRLFILTGINLPLLAVLRVFGGVPWDYLISSFASH